MALAGGFEDISQASLEGGGASRNLSPRQGDDLQYRVNSNLKPSELKVVPSGSQLWTCDGTGAKPGTSPVTCGRCHSFRVVNVDTQTHLG